MSKFTCVRLEIKDKECLKSALKELGFTEIEDHVEAQPLYGFQGDLRSEKAHIIVRRKYMGRASNDLGFAKNANGRYDMIISEYDASMRGQNFANKLSQLYGVQKIRKKMKSMGYTVTSQKTDTNGRIKIKVMVP